MHGQQNINKLENVESIKYLHRMLTNDGRYICKIKCRIAMAKAAFKKKWALFTSTLDLELRKKLMKCSIWSIALYDPKTWTPRVGDQKHLENLKCGIGEGRGRSIGLIM